MGERTKAHLVMMIIVPEITKMVILAQERNKRDMKEKKICCVLRVYSNAIWISLPFYIYVYRLSHLTNAALFYFIEFFFFFLSAVAGALCFYWNFPLLSLVFLCACRDKNFMTSSILTFVTFFSLTFLIYCQVMTNMKENECSIVLFIIFVSTFFKRQI